MSGNRRTLLTTAASVFDALGGVAGVMEVTGAKYKTVHAWKASGSFPSDTYVVMVEALKQRGLTASSSLWDMRFPAEAK